MGHPAGKQVAQTHLTSMVHSHEQDEGPSFLQTRMSSLTGSRIEGGVLE